MTSSLRNPPSREAMRTHKLQLSELYNPLSSLRYHSTNTITLKNNRQPRLSTKPNLSQPSLHHRRDLGSSSSRRRSLCQTSGSSLNWQGQTLKLSMICRVIFLMTTGSSSSSWRRSRPKKETSSKCSCKTTSTRRCSSKTLSSCLPSKVRRYSHR